jgi:hypothetical protein
MKVRKLAPVGVSVLAGALIMLPTSVSAKSPDAAHPQMIGGNAAVDVQTDIECTGHNIVAFVKNKTQGDITPKFVYQNMPVDTYDLAVAPGKTQQYMLPFTGNQTASDLTVEVDGQQDLNLRQVVGCNEPVTFTVDKTSEGAVSGYVRNNSNFVGATVFASVNGSDTRVVNLEPGKSLWVALPFTPSTIGILKSASGIPERAFVRIGTAQGYQGTYTVDLNRQPVPLPAVIMPEKKS